MNDENNEGSILIIIIIGIFLLFSTLKSADEDYMLKKRVTLLEKSTIEMAKEIFPNIEIEYTEMGGHIVEGLTITEYMATKVEEDDENNNPD